MKFYSFRASATGATLSIFDEIGGVGLQLGDFKASLDAVKGPALTVEINSPGGDVFAGLAMYNLLRTSGKTITTKVLGVAASAASVIFMGGDVREVPENAFLMIHNPWSVAVGGADDMRAEADVLDQISASMVTLYSKRSGQSESAVKKMLAAETWLNGTEAKAKGFATTTTPAAAAKASFNVAKAALPERVKAVFNPLNPAAKASFNVAKAALPERVKAVFNPLNPAAVYAARNNRKTK